MTKSSGVGRAAARQIVVVSPHFDDVPLSLGQSLLDGTLSRVEVEVHVVFGRTNWTTLVHPTRRRSRLVTAWRRLEEARAARRFGYRVSAEPFEEVILRLGTLDASEYLGDADPLADPLYLPIRQRLREWRRRGAELWVPAGLGGHIDHRLVAWAGADLLRSGVPGVVFYEDRPYASYLDEAGTRRGLSELGVDLEAVDVSGPIDASTQEIVRRCYRSQMSEYFLEAQRHDLASERPERVWRPVTPQARVGSR